MYVGFVVGAVLMIILYMWVIPPSLNRCDKAHPTNCNKDGHLIPAGKACKGGVDGEGCVSDYKCSGGEGQAGTCVPR